MSLNDSDLERSLAEAIARLDAFNVPHVQPGAYTIRYTQSLPLIFVVGDHAVDAAAAAESLADDGCCIPQETIWRVDTDPTR